LSRHVLIVDDDHDLAEGLAELLSMHGHKVEIAGNGKEAVDLYHRADFDIVFMDVRMPVMSGVDSFFAIRRFKPAARIVMMTGFQEPTVAQTLGAGALGLLYKPFRVEAMLTYINKIA
jgi:DNA-binding NtrC family response regulator